MKIGTKTRTVQGLFSGCVLLVLLCLSSESRALEPCIPASLLAADAEYSRIEPQLIELIRAAERLEEGAVDAGDHELIVQSLLLDGAIGSEARCWMNRLKLDSNGLIKDWVELGPLRMTPGGLALLRQISILRDGLSVILRIPEVGGWPVWARASLEEWLEANAPTLDLISEQYDLLLRASTRWPGALRLWLQRAKRRDLRTADFAELVGNLNIDIGTSDLPDSQPEYVLPLLIPTEGRYRHIGRQLENFLRFVSGHYSLPLWIRPISEESDIQDEIDSILSTGSKMFSVVGPIVRRDVDISFRDQEQEGLWFGFQAIDPSKENTRWFRLRPTASSLLESHALGLKDETQSEGLPGPIIVLGRPGRSLEHWTEEALKLWPGDEITALSYEPKDHDLSEYASMVANAKPGTVILAAPKADVGNLLRFLARAGVWARRAGKTIEEGEHHPYILGPTWFLQDPKFVQSNRFYLDGVRVVSDIPPLSEWLKEPLVAQFKAGYGIPPLIGLRVAGLLVRLAVLLEDGAFQPPTGTDWLKGETPWGHLGHTNSSLTFELQRYIFAGQKFRRQTSTEP